MFDQSIVPENSGPVDRHVLIVEKDPLQGYLLQVTLMEAGWSVSLAEGPVEALWQCEHDLFDVAIINADYPASINGFVLADRLRKRYHLPSLMITAARYTEFNNWPGFTVEQDLLFKPYRLLECSPRLQQLLAHRPLLHEYQTGL